MSPQEFERAIIRAEKEKNNDLVQHLCNEYDKLYPKQYYQFCLESEH
jgi:hypothetical protein